MGIKEPTLHIALPVMDELIALPRLMKALQLQTFKDFRIYICVNQPDSWWTDPGKRRICLDNQATLMFLESLHDERLVILDKSSPGKGWEGKNHGIGWARKTLMDHIAGQASDADFILSLDADTGFSPFYLESVRTNLLLNPKVVAFSIPYYHRLTGDEQLDRAILRYEIYMRAYAINLWRIQSPYSFTALGSAIALPVWAYKAIGGMTPKLSGEDFYFLQKLVKFGTVLHWNNEMIFPAGRLSERVFFGTGPALIKGIMGDWSSYPVYHESQFSAISHTYKLFPKLFGGDFVTPLDEFLTGKSGELPWAGLRKNARSKEQFVRSCHEKLDGLRILQFLKENNKAGSFSNEEATIELLDIIEKEQGFKTETENKGSLNFELSTVNILDEIRNTLVQSEMSYRKQHWSEYTGLNAVFN